MADKYINATQMLIDESAAYMSAQLNVDDMTRKINEIVHRKLQQLLIDGQEEDAVEVVRCKDCEHCKECSEENGKLLCLWCGLNDRIVANNDYCNYGVRKEE